MKNILSFLFPRFSVLFSESDSAPSSDFSNTMGFQTSPKKKRFSLSFPSMKNRNMKIPRRLLAVIGIFLFIFVLVLFIRHMMAAKPPQQQAATSTQIQGPLATETLNKEFTFPVSDSKGSAATNEISYVIQSAELRKEILLKGQPADAVKGRMFLVLNLKITNNQKHGIQIQTRDFVRLSVNGTSDLLAPDIHNDPVEVQAISTQYTRLGFVINETDKNMVLQVGAIDGPKQKVPLNFK